MTINGINGVNTQMGQTGVNQAADSYSKNIQNQIANAQKALQELSSNKELSPEEKMKKRQEIQKQISDLNVQLRQHQMEQRREKQQAKNSSMDDMSGGTGNTKAKSNGTGLSQAGVTAMISVDSAIKQAKVQGSVAARMDGRSGILESEIKLDRARGCDTHKKEEELAKAEQKAQEAVSSQLSTLADAGRTMEEAAKADAETTMEEAAKSEAGTTMEEAAKADGRQEKTDKNAGTEDADENVSGTDTPGEGTAVQSDAPVSNGAGTAKGAPQQATHHVSVDIRL